MLQNKPSHWAEVPIGEILKYLDDQVMFDDMAEYITITVKRRHGGLEAREKLFGHEIKTKKQYRLHRGAFIISRVQCWHAAYAIVPDDIPENMIASQNYDQFEISPKVDRQFFWWLSHSPQFIETVRSSASGVVIEKLVFNRDAWLQKTIPVPPLDEQRRIVAHIESLAARVNEAQRLREEADVEAEALVAAGTRQLFNTHSWKMISIEEFIGRENLKNGKSLKSDEQPSEVSCLRISALRNGKIDCRDTKPISITVEDAKPYIIQKDDVYIVRGNGSKDLVGRAGLVEEYKGVIIFPDLFIKVPLNTNQMLPAFLWHGGIHLLCGKRLLI